MIKCAAYIRVSTSEQTTDNQLPDIKRLAEARGYELAHVYSEQESAWRQGHQHELARLLNDIRSGKRHYDVLLVWALDRLSRQGIASTLQLINTFELYGCHVISCREAWTHPEAGPMREMFIAMSAWAAKFESDRRSERTKAGLALKRLEGKGKRGKDKRKRKKRDYTLEKASRISQARI